MTRAVPRRSSRYRGPIAAPGTYARHALVAIAAGLLAAVTLAAPAWASTPAAKVGKAIITEPGRATPLNGGGSATSYGVELPAGAGCPGDTAHDGYHVFSYLVPKGQSPTSVSFKTGDPSHGFGYIADGAYYGAVNTDPDTGSLQPLPTDFTWTRLTPSDLFGHSTAAATWEGGVACADTHGQVTNYWNTEIVFRPATGDRGGFTWSVSAPVARHRGSDAALILFLAVVVGVGSLAVGRSRRRAHTPASSRPGQTSTSTPRSEQHVGG